MSNRLTFRLGPEEADALSSPQALDIIMEHPHLSPAARSAILSIALQHQNRAPEAPNVEAPKRNYILDAREGVMYNRVKENKKWFPKNTSWDLM